MDAQHVNEETQNSILEKVQVPVAILKNMNVNDDSRNQGYGKKAIQKFLNESKEANYVILISDGGETNNFNLQEWYERLGFESIGETGYYSRFPVMLLER